METSSEQAVAKRPTRVQGCARAASKRPASAAKAAAQKAAQQQQTVDQVAEKYRLELDEALELAIAAHCQSPQQAKPVVVKKPGKAPKIKWVRDSFTIPAEEYAQITRLKKRLGGSYKKSDLLRGGLAVLSALADDELKIIMAHIDRIEDMRLAEKKS
ncbi:MAG: hypothetical protein LBV49_13210 [Azonexus sp.]|jgi:hypothetical protein|nr:hypothetical protein [Azonexus sp.]